MGYRNPAMTRRSALTGAAAAGLAAFGRPASKTAAAQPAPAVRTATRLSVTGYYRSAAYLTAVQRGLFVKEGLDIDFHLVRLAPEHNQGLADGRWPITMSSADTMLARTTQDKVDFVLFMQVEQGLDVQMVVQPGIKTFADLRGKLFAADPVDSNYDLIRNKIMLQHGVRENEYRTIVLGPSRVRAAAFAAGKVDAAMLAPPATERALAKGGVILAEGADYIPGWPINCGWALRRWAEANRSTVVRFVRAMARASDWLLQPEHREETIRLLMREEKLSRARAEKSYRFARPQCALDPQSIRQDLEIRIELGYYKPPHRPTEAFYDLSFWREATGQPAPAPAGMPRNAVRG
jgi:ABC-type nitrate/sulfonate/bicarbonate transport system substrate-binding protein